MVNRSDFKDLVLSIEINSNTSFQNRNYQIGKLYDWVRGHLPFHLYRYRSCSEYAIADFENDEIRGSFISSYNDPYECIPRYDIDSFNRLIYKDIPEILHANNRNLEIGEFWSTVTKPELIELHSNLMSKSFVEREQILNDALRHAIDWIEKHQKMIISRFFIDVKKRELNKLIACFSEEQTSGLMWSHYAKSHTGFCLEYDLSELIEHKVMNIGDLGCNNICMNPVLVPIIYDNKRYDATKHLAFAVIQQEMNKYFGKDWPLFYLDSLFILKSLIWKSSNWKYENEWRLFKDSDRAEPHGVIAKLKPTALYIGCNTSICDRTKLMDIAEIKDIPVYVMQLNNDESGYDLSYKNAYFF